MKLVALKLIYDVVTRWDSAYKMLSRALYLRKAIEYFVSEDDEFQQYQLTKKEWDQAAIVCTILLPFKLTSQRLQATKRPGIDSVFWDYESLFNKIDAIKETFNQPEYIGQEWIQELHIGVEKLSKKLSDYYLKTAMPFVYSDSCILEPRGKLILFKQPRFGGGEVGQYVEAYKQGCHERYIRNYEPVNLEASNPRKRQHEESDDESDDGDYRSFLHRAAQPAVDNEFSQYLQSPIPDSKSKTLKYWKDHATLFPHLSLMARDLFSVPATGAGVERIFSKSGRVATWTRARLQSRTINETMLYKENLNRNGQSLNADEERRKAECRKERKKNPKSIEEDHSESDDDEEEESELIKWELEWWRKEGAGIIN